MLSEERGCRDPPLVVHLLIRVANIPNPNHRVVGVANRLVARKIALAADVDDIRETFALAKGSESFGLPIKHRPNTARSVGFRHICRYPHELITAFDKDRRGGPNLFSGVIE